MNNLLVAQAIPEVKAIPAIQLIKELESLNGKTITVSVKSTVPTFHVVENFYVRQNHNLVTFFQRDEESDLLSFDKTKIHSITADEWLNDGAYDRHITLTDGTILNIRCE